MADHSLITPLPIDVSSLDPDDYTASLTHAAIKSGLLGGQALQTMQDQLFGILHDQIEQATHGESTLSLIHIFKGCTSVDMIQTVLRKLPHLRFGVELH